MLTLGRRCHRDEDIRTPKSDTHPGVHLCARSGVGSSGLTCREGAMSTHCFSLLFALFLWWKIEWRPQLGF